MQTAPFSGTQPVHAAIQQAAAVCLQTLVKCFIVGPLERVRVHAGSVTQKASISKQCGFFSFATTEPGKPLLKKLLHAASKQQEAVLNSVFFVSKIPFQILSGF